MPKKLADATCISRGEASAYRVTRRIHLLNTLATGWRESNEFCMWMGTLLYRAECLEFRRGRAFSVIQYVLGS